MARGVECVERSEVLTLGGGLLPSPGITTGVLSLPIGPPGRASRGPHPRPPREYRRVRPRRLTRSGAPHHGCEDGRRHARTPMLHLPSRNCGRRAAVSRWRSAYVTLPLVQTRGRKSRAHGEDRREAQQIRL